MEGVETAVQNGWKESGERALKEKRVALIFQRKNQHLHKGIFQASVGRPGQVENLSHIHY